MINQSIMVFFLSTGKLFLPDYLSLYPLPLTSEPP